MIYRPCRLLVSTLLVLATGCPSQEAPQETAVGVPTEPVIHAAVLEARRVEIPVIVEVTGRVTPVFEATLSSKVQGIVQDLHAREGTQVSKGKVLVTLDSRELRASLARAEAEMENARTHFARMERLYAEDSVAKLELDEARRAFKVATALLEEAKARLSYTVIQAPFSGVIADLFIEVGELASPGQPVLRIEDPRQLQLEATVGERDVKAIVEGEKIPVTIDALESSALEGILLRILPSGDPATHTFLVKVALPPTPGLKTSMFGRMGLQRGVTHAILLPRSAVVERGNLTGVYVVGEDRRASLRWIKVGRARDQHLEVLSGLNPGERVLADARTGKDGARIETTESPSKLSPS